MPSLISSRANPASLKSVFFHKRSNSFFSFSLRTPKVTMTCLVLTARGLVDEAALRSGFLVVMVVVTFAILGFNFYIKTLILFIYSSFGEL